MQTKSVTRFIQGASTFCCSGSTACPSLAAKSIREGWKLGTIYDTYLRYEAASDCYVGRTVCDLPMNHADFRVAILPPFFKCESGESRMDVDRVIDQLFPNLDAKKKYIAEQAIAAVVYHQDWLRRTMPANHPLFETELFSYHEFLPLLSRYISIDGNGRKPTGLPPHVITIRSMEEMKGSVDGMNGNITEMRGSINHLTETNATMEEKLASCFRTSADSSFRAIAENRPLANSLENGGTGTDAGVKAAAEDKYGECITRQGDGKWREKMDAKMQGIQDTLEELKGAIKGFEEGMKEIKRGVAL